MKVVKPLKLGVVSRVVEHRGALTFSVGVLVFTPLSGAPLLPEQDLWKFLAETLKEDIGFEPGMPKSRAEALVYGSAYPPGGSAASCFVRLQLGTIDKTLYVFGDRHWEDGAPTDPVPFTAMPLDWSRAFGGEGYPQNPRGRGMLPVVNPTLGRAVVPLPNVEWSDRRVVGTADRPPPAGFGPVDFAWPQRQSKAGTYDAKWLAERFPGLADDIDWTIFNAAQSDQWAEGFFRGDEAFTLTNLHPSRPKITGKLPGYLSRVFVTLQSPGDDGTVTARFVEAPARLDTVFFFPDHDRMLQVFRATFSVREDDHADVEHLLLCLEEPGDARPVEHYRAVLEKRLDKEKGAIEALRDRDLLPTPRAHAPKVPAMGDAFLDATRPEGRHQAHVRARMERERVAARERAEALGLNPDDFAPPQPAAPPPTVDLDNVADVAQSMDEEEAKLRATAESRRAEMLTRRREVLLAEGYDPDTFFPEDTGGPPTYRADEDFAQMQATVALGEAYGMPDPGLAAKVRDPKTLPELRDREAQLRAIYQQTGHFQPRARRRTAEDSARLRAALEAALARGESLAGVDLTGADLRGVKLVRVDLREALLECADLTGADLTGANLTRAMLARADLTDATLADTTATGINFGEAILRRTRLDGATLDEAILHRVVFDRASLVGTSLKKVELLEATVTGLDLSEAVCDDLTVIRTPLQGLRAVRAQLPRATFIESPLDEVEAWGADFTGTLFVGVRCRGGNFTEARLDKTKFVQACDWTGVSLLGASLQESLLRDMVLREARLSRVNLTDADLSGADLESAELHQMSARRSRWVRAKLTRAGMIHADLMDAILQKAHLRGADLLGANLYRADLFGANSDRGTRLEDANLTKVRIDRRPK